MVYNESNSAITSNKIYSILVEPNGESWIGTRKGLNKFNEEDWIYYNTDMFGLPVRNIKALALDSNEQLWIGSQGGLAKFDGVYCDVYSANLSILF